MTGGFLLLLAWLNYLDRQAVIPLAIVACTLHELGHYAAIRAMGGNIKLIRLTAIGAEMLFSTPMNYWQEGVAALAGPAVNLLLARIFCSWTWGSLFAGINLVLGCFNLLPANGLDGWRALYCVTALTAGPNIAEAVGKFLGILSTAFILGSAICLLGLGGNICLLLVAFWLLMMQNNHGCAQK